jgi:hypothetical protein
VVPSPEEIKRKELLEVFLGVDANGGEVDEHELQYEPLPEMDLRPDRRRTGGTIRLIHLLPGKGFEPIKVSMNISDGITEYEALSYYWGGSSTHSLISCNGFRLQVTQNLKSALRDLRHPDTSRVLWIDAICINQQDVREREQQVSIMGDIYRGAIRTVVWLGETFAGNELAFQMVKRMYDVHYEKLDSLSDYYDLTRILVDGKRITKVPVGDPTSPTKDELNALYFLLRRPWFCRMWVIQEVVLAKEVLIQCGDQKCDWDQFAAGLVLATFLFEYWKVSTASMQRFLDLASLRGDAEKIPGTSPEAASEEEASEDAFSLDLLSLLYRFRSFLSTDKRDKIYALMGLTDTDLVRIHLVPDYRSSPQQVYTRLAESLFNSSDTLDLLSIPHGTTEFSKTLPSWVPDWSDSLASDPLVIGQTDKSDFKYSLFRATGQSNADALSFGEDNVLSLHGHRLDRLRTLSSIFPRIQATIGELLEKKTEFLTINHSTPHENTLARLRRLCRGLAFTSDFCKYAFVVLSESTHQLDTLFLWDKMALGDESDETRTVYAPTGETLETAYMATLSTNWMPAGPESALENFRILRQSYRRNLRKVKMNMLPVRYHWLITILQLVITFLRRMFRLEGPSQSFIKMMSVTARRLCWTEAGHLALVPGETRLDDEVWLLRGGKLPFILRRVDGGDFELIGDCYIHGVMDGEKFEEEKCVKVTIV